MLEAFEIGNIIFDIFSCVFLQYKFLFFSLHAESEMQRLRDLHRPSSPVYDLEAEVRRDKLVSSKPRLLEQREDTTTSSGSNEEVDSGPAKKTSNHFIPLHSSSLFIAIFLLTASFGAIEPDESKSKIDPQRKLIAVATRDDPPPSTFGAKQRALAALWEPSTSGTSVKLLKPRTVPTEASQQS